MITTEYWACCDICHSSAPMVDFPQPRTKKEALAQALSSGWQLKAGKLACSKCKDRGETKV